MNRILPRMAAWFLGDVLRLRENFRAYFLALQKKGIHLLPNHFYFPAPDTRFLDDKIWSKREKNLVIGLDFNEVFQNELLETISSYAREFAQSLEMDPPPHRFCFSNESFGSVDAEMLYGIIRLFKPRRIIEVGSGWSTLISDYATRRNQEEGKECFLTAIDPFPRREIASVLSERHSHIAKPVQELDRSIFEELRSGDILFIDSSHVLKIGGDVQFLFLEIIPRLAPGVMIHVHDIFLPREYPKSWIKERFYFWTEQYLLQAFLSFNTAFEVMWAGCYMHSFSSEKLEAVFSSYDPKRTLPGSFWFRCIK